MKKLRAIKIDVSKKTITEISIERNLESYYKEIGCSLIEFVTINKANDLIVDEEGLYSNVNTFKFRGNVIFGNALIVGINKDGNTVNTSLTVEKIKSMVQFN